MDTFLNIFANLPSLQVRDLIDIFIVALIIYLIITFIHQSRSYFILYILVFLFGVNFLASELNLSLTRQIFKPLLTFVLLFFLVVFQREIRRFFEWFSAHGRKLTQRQIALSSDSAKTISDTVFEMAQKRTGAIIVLAGDYSLDQVTEGGFVLDGRISRPLLLSIFDPSSPGHDGAVVVAQNRIRKFGVHLPLAEKFNNHSTMGTRHRATAGITQRTDAVAIVVSEERGEISWSEGGELLKISSIDELEKKVSGFLKVNLDLSAISGWHAWLTRHWARKLLSLFFSFILWSVFVYQIGVTSEIFTVPIEFQYLPKNMQMEEVVPVKVNVTLSGSYSDLRGLDVSKDLKVAIDAKDIGEGKQKIDLLPSNVQYPSFLSLVEIKPKTLVVNVSSADAQKASLPGDKIQSNIK